ncbi:hypothetical protein ACT6QG_11605 [Xanthobacter sp. TB0136]|uniref:hypothetical protein n=1 Tax=Xanthobacter sp. TB0136 TaxID=3459177 RepID=UPI00403A0B7A
MFQIGMLVWSILSVTFAGMLILVVLIVPELTPTDDMSAIPIAAAIGAVLAIPAAYFVARKVYAMTAGREVKGTRD